MNKNIVARALHIAAVLGVAMLTTNASAKTLSDALTECGNVENSLKRLVCYDQIVKEMQQYTGLDEAISKGIITAPVPATAASQSAPSVATSAPAVQPRVVQSAQSTPNNPEEVFGKQIVRADANIEKLYYNVTGVEKNRYDRVTVTMANGHTWRQTDSGTFRIKEGDRVYVERGALGSFFLSKDDANRRIRVVRVN